MINPKQAQKKTRYTALDLTGRILATGLRLGDIQGYGPRILIDWKTRRTAIESHYPVIRPNWRIVP